MVTRCLSWLWCGRDFFLPSFIKTSWTTSPSQLWGNSLRNLHYKSCTLMRERSVSLTSHPNIRRWLYHAHSLVDGWLKGEKSNLEDSQMEDVLHQRRNWRRVQLNPEMKRTWELRGERKYLCISSFCTSCQCVFLVMAGSSAQIAPSVFKMLQTLSVAAGGAYRVIVRR